MKRMARRVTSYNSCLTSTGKLAYIGREAVDNGGTHILDRFVKQLVHSIEQLQKTEQWADSLGKSAHYLNTDMRRKYNIPDDDHIGWKTLGHLLSRSWVERLWVVQEAAVAREVMIQCGPYSFDFEDIAAAYNLMWTLSVPEVHNISTHFKSVVAERVKQRSGQQGTLLSLVIRHWLSYCTHQQDKIYALRGLASDVGPGLHGNNFDYEKSADVVYTEFARDAIKFYRNLDILSALAPFHKDRSGGLPSWVPDWRVFENYTLVYRRPEPPPETGPCNILFTTSGTTYTDPVFSEDGHRVRLYGHVLDTIIDVGAIRPGRRTPGKAVAHFVGWRNKIARCLDEKYYEPTRELMIDVFYHTITMANLSNFLDDALAEYKVFDRSLLMLADRLEDRYSHHYGNGVVPRVQVAGVWEAVPTWLSIEKSVVTSASRPSVNRRMVRTERGYLGLVHGQTQVGDKIALFRGGSLPLVIREQGKVWRMVGDGYVHGVMSGEEFEDDKCEPFWFC
ncbi:Nn.00g062230.m01.CDS01 [Neocucurbitaria sp. VM-36]